jgi:hypothetical protein
MIGRLVVAIGMSLGGVVVGVAQEGGGAAPASGEARVNGQSIVLAHAYLMHAPDNWRENEVNVVVLLTQQPVDETALRAASTLSEALQVAPERVVVEVRATGGQADLSICHPEFGDGMCYSTTISPPEWSVAEAAEGHVAGSVRTFTGEEEEIFDGKYKLFYEFRFDAAPVRDFDRRR